MISLVAVVSFQELRLAVEVVDAVVSLMTVVSVQEFCVAVEVVEVVTSHKSQVTTHDPHVGWPTSRKLVYQQKKLVMSGRRGWVTVRHPTAQVENHNQLSRTADS